jgi:hypothetical protein
VGLAAPTVFDLSNKPIQSKPDSRGGVLHSLRVFQNPEALVGIRGIWLNEKPKWGDSDRATSGLQPGRC